MRNYKGNTDILFFCNLLKALKTSKNDQLQSKWINTVSIDDIRDIAIEISQSTDKNEKKQLLKEIYDMLTASIPKKHKCIECEICIITDKTRGIRRIIVPKTNINNKNKNKNTTCRKYKICKENSNQICIETL